MEDEKASLESKFAGLAVNDSSSNSNGNNNDNNMSSINPNSDGLFQVMKAVEAAEATIKQQVLIFFSLFQFLRI